MKKFLAAVLFTAVGVLLSSNALAQSSHEEQPFLTLSCNKVEAIADVLKIQEVYGHENALLLYGIYKKWGTCSDERRAPLDEVDEPLERGEYMVERPDGVRRIAFHRGRTTGQYYVHLFTGGL